MPQERFVEHLAAHAVCEGVVPHEIDFNCPRAPSPEDGDAPRRTRLDVVELGVYLRDERLKSSRIDIIFRFKRFPLYVLV